MCPTGYADAVVQSFKRHRELVLMEVETSSDSDYEEQQADLWEDAALHGVEQRARELAADCPMVLLVR